MRTASLVLLLALVAGCGTTERVSAQRERFRVLVLTKTTGFRHDSIPDGIAAIQRLGRRHGFAVDTTEDATRFTSRNLARYDALIFLSTTGDPVDGASERAAMRRYIERGGGFLGIHAASDMHPVWPWYERLIGTRFKRHPAIASATVRIEPPRTPATRGLPAAWTRTDEWYDFTFDPRSRVRVLATVDESTYAGGGMGKDHPIAWCHRYDGGRSVYTAMGHTKESYADPAFTDRHLLGAIEMAAGHARFDCGVRVTQGAGEG
jgi:type 1 glutamine amidotransferase